MRSSIACARCRKSKVKCVNLGVHTTCKACESSSRECVYPVPGGAGGGSTVSSTSNVSGVVSGSGHSTGESASGQQVIGAGTGVGSSTGGSGSGSGSGTGQSRPRPKKPSASAAGSAIGGQGGHGGAVGSGVGYGGSGGAKGESGAGGKMKAGSAGAGTGAGLGSGGVGGSSGGLGGAGERPTNIYGALVEGCGIPSAEDVLGDGNIGWQFWHAMHEHFQHHYSTELPFVHAPTFLARRLDLPSQHIIPRSRLPSASSTSATPTTAGTVAVDKTSYPLCLGILTLTGRFYPPLIKLHQAHASAPSGSAIPSTTSGTQSSSSKSGKSSVSSTNPLPAAEGRKIGEFYARALRRYLFTPHSVTGHIEISVPTVEKVQGLLMLAVHEWIGEGRADRAQVWVGFAGRLAVQMGLGRTQISVLPSLEEGGEALGVFAEEEGDLIVGTMEIDAPEGGSAARKRRKLSVASGGSGGSLSGSALAFAQTPVEKEKERKELIIRDEIARRTFWSLFMLDRQLCSGAKRDLVVRVEDINGWANRVSVDEYEIPDDEEGPGKTVVRLPCSDKSFTFGDAVVTDVLRIGSGGIGGEGGGGGGGYDEGSGENETELCRIIRGMEIWGRVRRWRGPASRDSNLSRGGSPGPLPEQVAMAYPPQPPSSFMTLNLMINSYSSPLPNNLLFSPDNLNAHIHSKTSTSYAIIHVINFLSRMVLHKTNLPFIPPYQQSTSQIPTYVVDSAKEVFRSARGLLDLMKGLTDWNVGIETPLVAYAVYIAGVWSVYACSFPYLDEESQLAYPGAGGEVEENVNVQTAIDHLKRFHSRWNLGGGDGRRWVDGVTRLAHFYKKVKAASTTAAASPSPKPTAGARINGMGTATIIVPSALLFGEEGSRFERMWRELGRDELAGWISPPVPAATVSTAGGLAPPQPQGQQGSGKKGSAGGERKRVSPQPPQAKLSDRWHAINKGPINPSSPPTSSSTIPPAGASQAYPQASSYPQQQQQQQSAGTTSPTALIDQFVPPGLTSPKKRHASEMDSTDYPFPNVGKDEGSDQGIHSQSTHHQPWAGAQQQQQQQGPSTSGQGSTSGGPGGVEVKMEWEEERRG